MKFSTSVPNCREGRMNPIGSVTLDWMRTVAQEAEQLGYYSLWLNEFLDTEPRVRGRGAQPPSYYDSIVTIADLAGKTSAIRFMPTIIALPHHAPLVLARQLATLDQYSNGRLSLGIGLGSASSDFRRLRGDLVSPNRGQMMDEYTAALRALWDASSTSATFDGKYVSFQGVESWPKPKQSRMPIMMAGDAAGVVDRIAQFGDGWIDFGNKPTQIEEQVQRVQDATTSQGRGTASLEFIRQFYVSIGDTEQAAVENVSESLERSTLPESPPEYESFVIGTSESITERLRPYMTCGITEIGAVFFAPDGPENVRQLRRFAAEVVPGLLGSL